MSLPSVLTLCRYGPFAGKVELPLRPLTLLYGRNNAGKSALVRLFALLGASVTRDASSALRLPEEVFAGQGFPDLAWQGDAGDYTFEIGLRWPEGMVREARYVVDGGEELPPYVKELQVLGAEDAPLWSGAAAPGRPLRPAAQLPPGEVRCAGLIPAGAALPPPLQELALRMDGLRGRLSWLKGVRARPPRWNERGTQPPAALTASGDNAAQLLLWRPELVAEVARFYRRLDPPRDLEVREELKRGHRLLLNPVSQPSFRIDLLNTGEGMVQVLPVLLGAALAAREGGLLAVEEPESHLHPDAQRALAESLCGLAAGATPPTLVLETHSRVFLLGVQVAVARGQISRTDVGLVWVDQDALGRSTITQVELDEGGRLGLGWPVTALAEDLRLSAELSRQGRQGRG